MLLTEKFLLWYSFNGEFHPFLTGHTEIFRASATPISSPLALACGGHNRIAAPSCSLPALLQAAAKRVDPSSCRKRSSMMHVIGTHTAKGARVLRLYVGCSSWPRVRLYARICKSWRCLLQYFGALEDHTKGPPSLLQLDRHSRLQFAPFETQKTDAPALAVRPEGRNFSCGSYPAPVKRTRYGDGLPTSEQASQPALFAKVHHPLSPRASGSHPLTLCIPAWCRKVCTEALRARRT